MMAGKSIWIYMDSNNCLSAVTRGDSNTEAIAILVGRLWATLQRNHIYSWFSRVPSKQSPGDLPTRNRRIPSPVSRKESFKSISSLYRTARSQLKKFDFRPEMGPKLGLNHAIGMVCGCSSISRIRLFGISPLTLEV